METTDPVTQTAGTCTNCGTPFSAGPRRGSIGEPLRQCRACGKIALCPGVNEWSLVRAGEKAGFVANHVIVALVIGVAAPLVGWAIARSLDRPWSAWDAMLCAAGGLAVGALWQGMLLSRTIRRSQMRMSDPMYVAKLIEHQLAGRR